MLLVQRITLPSFCILLSIAATVKGSDWLFNLEDYLNAANSRGDDEGSSSQNEASYDYGHAGTSNPGYAHNSACPARHCHSFHSGFHGHPPTDSSFKPFVNGFHFIKTKWNTPDGFARTHILTTLAPRPSVFCATFKLPEVNLEEHAYIQLWALSPDRSRTAEIGLMKSEDSKHWTALIFNTDNRFVNAWLGDNALDGADESSKRTVVANPVKLDCGDEVELVTELSTDFIKAWVNDVYIGKIIINYPIGHFEFGFEMVGHIDKTFEVHTVAQQ